MYRYLVLSLLVLLSTTVVFAANTTVVLNGKVVSLPVIDAAGKAYVDIVALMQMLGGKATYDAAADKLYISSTAPATAGGGGGGAPGTAQLAGDNGELGKVYTLGKASPLYFSLKKAEYTVSQVSVGDQTVTPTVDEKLLVLHFTVQNPQKTEQYVRFDSLRFTVVDALNANHEGRNDWGDVQNRAPMAQTLKPAQTVECYTAIAVPAAGEVPKLMVLPSQENDGPVLRYDLRGQVAALPAPVADPADATGATALETVPAQLNAACSLAIFDVTVEKTEYVTTALEGEAPEDGARFLVATLLLKNKSATNTYLRWDAIQPVLTSGDGEELAYKEMLAATANRSIAQDTKAGSELRVRIYFVVPKDVATKTLAIKEGESRTYQFEVPQ